MFKLDSRVAVITGASAGVGRQLALALAKQGANIVLLARRIDKLHEVEKEIRALNVETLCVKCDVTVAQDVDNAVNATMQRFGRVDILVNNAGGGDGAPTALQDLDDDTWKFFIEVNLMGVVNCTKKFGAHMLDAGYGRVINIASIMGLVGNKQLTVTPYHTTKGAVVNFTRAAAAEWATRGVTVNCICPGFFASEANSPQAMEKLNGFITTFTPMARAGVDGELDSSVVFLAADESSYVTGLILPCDGGWTCV